MFFEKKEVLPDDAQEDDSESSYSRRYRKELEEFEVNEGAEGIASIKEEPVLPKEKIVPSEKRIMMPIKEITFPKEEMVPYKIATKMPTGLEFEKINSEIDSIITWIRQFYERFNYVCDNIQKIRAMGLENKKKISSITEDLTKAMEIANRVSPEKLRTDSKRLDMKISTLNEKFEANREFMNNVLDEVREVKREANIFIGAEDELSELNKEVKSDLTEIQKLGTKVRLDADKSEKIFIELRKVLSEVQRTNDEFNNFNTVSSELRSEIEKLKIKYASLDESIKKTLLISEKGKKESERLVSGVRIEDIKKIREHETKLDVFQEVANNLTIQILELKSKYGNLDESIKKTLLEKGKKETERFTGARPIESEKLKAYEDRLDNILGLIDNLSREVSEIKRKMAIIPKKIEKNLVKKPSSIEKQFGAPSIPLLIKAARIQKEPINREKKPAFEKLPKKSAVQEPYKPKEIFKFPELPKLPPLKQKEPINREKKPAFEKLPKKSAVQEPYKPKEISEFPELPELPTLKQKEPTTIKKKLITNPSFN